MEWVRGNEIGYGSFSTVNLAITKNPNPRFPQIMAVKSSSISQSDMLLREKSILEELGEYPQIIRCFGGDYSIEKGEKKYNLFLEYATGGTLADKMKKQSSSRFSESEVRLYTKSILEGIKYVHEKGYVHCDLKLENILVFSSPENSDKVKIADFGLATKRVRGVDLRGTPLYMSPEMVAGAPADIWAIGCMVSEMISGAPAWRCLPEYGVLRLLMRIGVGDELPDIPTDLSPDGREFLEKIFVKDPRQRWTAQMLLDHPFVTDRFCREDLNMISPKGPLDCIDDYNRSVGSSCLLTKVPSLDFNSSPCSVINVLVLDLDMLCSRQMDSVRSSCEITKKPLSDFDTWSSEVCFDSLADRLQHLVTCQGPDWSETDSWIVVR